MHLRRALLLFAIVLGLAAIAASVSRPRDTAGERAAPTTTESRPAPTVSPGNASTGEPPVEVAFDDAARGEPTRRLPAGQAATVLVEVEEAGQVEIPDLGLSATGDPVTPARFDVFGSAPGSYEIRFTPASADESDTVGTLAIEAGSD